jgi:sorting nexin-8
MSLFGTSPDESSSISQIKRSEPKSLFDNQQVPGTTSNPSLFDDNGDGPSPWDLPTPKKPGRGDLVKTLLPASSVPESYIDAYDTLLESGLKTASATLSLQGAQKLYDGSGIEPAEQARILRLVSNGQNFEKGLTRSEFNVFLALVALSQQNEEATLDGVDERRKSTCEPCTARNLLGVTDRY